MGSDVLMVGLIGHPIGHSRSPALHQTAFDALGIPARYVLWDTQPDALAARVAALRGQGMLGANVTIPYKAMVLPLLDVVSPGATSAVNTIVREETTTGLRLIGYNTDILGLRRALAEADAWRAGGRVLILGAGGAARAALAVAPPGGGRARIAARDVAAARMDGAIGPTALRGGSVGDSSQSTPEALDLADTATLAAALRDTDLLINATPVGTNDPTVIPLSAELLQQLPSGAFVFDMVYSPPETALVRAARARGLRASGGLPMLLYQGAEAFRLWTRREPPLDAMRAALGLGA